MMYQSAAFSETKSRVRKLKNAEKKIRHISDDSESVPTLVWDSFFDLHNPPVGNARYSLSFLTSMSREEYKHAVDEYFAHVYYEYYNEHGIAYVKTYAPAILAKLDLPFNAEEHDIKKRFRELALKYHPDTGGDSEKFIELMRVYEDLIKSKR